MYGLASVRKLLASAVLAACVCGCVGTGCLAEERPLFFTNPIGDRAAPDPFVTYDAATDF